MEFVLRWLIRYLDEQSHAGLPTDVEPSTSFPSLSHPFASLFTKEVSHPKDVGLMLGLCISYKGKVVPVL
jgi:hypothetical protein